MNKKDLIVGKSYRHPVFPSDLLYVGDGVFRTYYGDIKANECTIAPLISIREFYDYGSGEGNSYGDGYGEGFGNGEGYGYGRGDGRGDGDGDGRGYGYSYGDGYGTGKGFGYEDGYGCGYSEGYDDRGDHCFDLDRFDDDYWKFKDIPVYSYGSGYGGGCGDGTGKGYGIGDRRGFVNGYNDKEKK
jgi:hypothetical protein